MGISSGSVQDKSSNPCFGFLQNSLTSENRWKRNDHVFLGEKATSKKPLTVNATCYRYELGCGCSGGQEVVNGALEAATGNRRFVNPSGEEGSASWTSEDHGVVASVNQADDASGVEMGFSRVIALDPGP